MTTSTALAKADAAAFEKHAEVVDAVPCEDNGLETLTLEEWRSRVQAEGERRADWEERTVKLWFFNKLGTQAQLAKELKVTARTVRRRLQSLRGKREIPPLDPTDGRKDAQKDRKKEGTKAPSRVLESWNHAMTGVNYVLKQIPANRLSEVKRAQMKVDLSAKYMETADNIDDVEAREAIESEMATWQETVKSATATKPKQLPQKAKQETKPPGEQMSIDMGAEPTPKPTPEPEWGSEASEAQESTPEPTPEPTPAPESKGTGDQKPAEESDTATESDEECPLTDAMKRLPEMLGVKQEEAPKGPEPGEELKTTFEEVAAEANCK